MGKKNKILRLIIKVLVKDPKLTISLLCNIFFFIGKKKYYTVISLTEHLGDIIAAEPISRFLKEKDPKKKIVWVINKKYRELIDNNPSIAKVRTVTSLTEWILLKRLIRHISLYDLHISGRRCEKHGLYLENINDSGITMENYFHKGNLLFCFSRIAGLIVDDTLPPRLYLPQPSNNLSFAKGNYIIIHTSTNSPSKNWSTLCWNQLVDDLLTNYSPDIIIEIGFKSQISIEHNKLIRYCGVQRLNSISHLIKNSTLFIGTESGFAHMANALEKECIILAGSLSNFENYLPYSGRLMGKNLETLLIFSNPLAKVSYQEAWPRINNILINRYISN